MAATAAAALQLANEWESPFDHIDESSFSVDPAVTAAASGAVKEILRAIQTDAAPQPPPPVVTPIDPPLQGMNYKVCRKKINNFFLKQFTEKSCYKVMAMWSKNSPFPRVGDDTELDKLLQDLGLAKNRRYASTKWFEFKEARGIVPPPAFVCKASEFASIAANIMALEIVESAINKTVLLLMNDAAAPKFEGCNAIANDPQIQSHLKHEVLRFTNGLMRALDGKSKHSLAKDKEGHATRANRPRS
jgi:hypothetical protein